MILPNTKIEKCADPKESRPHIRDVHFDGKRLMATNGHILAVIPVEAGEGDIPGPVPLDAIKLARKTRLLDVGLEEKEALAAGVKFPRVMEGKYPNIDQVMPLASSDKPDMVIDAKLLLDLALALSTDSKQPIVKLWFARCEDDSQGIDRHSAIRVEALEKDNEGVGCIMPCGHRE